MTRDQVPRFDASPAVPKLRSKCARFPIAAYSWLRFDFFDRIADDLRQSRSFERECFACR
jgi:hypothetical protein